MNDTYSWESPFHEGEQAIQSRLGIRDRIERQGQRAIRPYMTEQHQEFVTGLPFIVAGSVDGQGRPWASLLTGDPGFVRPLGDKRLRVASLPWELDPIAGAIREGADVGLLGIDMTNRRRNRFTGRVAMVEDDAFEMDVVQTSGACPKYIQMRTYAEPEGVAPTRSEAQTRLAGEAAAVVRESDVFFIASAYGSSEAAASQGADVSHRGGKKGFVRLDQDGMRLTYPEFVGNNQFNTLGNIMKNPKVGMVFPDLDGNRTVTLTGQARILWGGDELAAFEGALRMVEIRIETAYFIKGLYPFRMVFDRDEKGNLKTGSWEEVAQILG